MNLVNGELMCTKQSTHSIDRNHGRRWTLDFTTGAGNSPQLVSTYPADGATGVPINTSIVLTFDQPVFGIPEGAVYINLADSIVASVNANDPSFSTAIVGRGTNQITIRPFVSPSSSLQPFTEYYVTIRGAGFDQCGGSNSFANAAGIAYPGFCDATTLNFTTGAGANSDGSVDSTAPTLVSASPANGATGVAQEPASITLTFNEPVYGGSKEMTIHYASDGSVFMFFDNNPNTTGTINTAGIDLNGNIAPVILTPKWQSAGGTVPQLPAGTEFYITIPSNSFRDWTGNYYAGITDPTALTFTTGG